jgi:hypothetical protein
MRRHVYEVFLAAAAVVVILGMVALAAVLFRNGIQLGVVFFSQQLPSIVAKVWSDPWYILAIILAALLVWTVPEWDRSNDSSEQPVRRGRTVTQFPRAAPRAYSSRFAARPTRSSGPRPSASAGRRQSATSKVRRSS